MKHEKILVWDSPIALTVLAGADSGLCDVFGAGIHNGKVIFVYLCIL